MDVSESNKQSVNGAVLIVLSVVLTASVAFLAWTAQSVYNLNAEMSGMKNQIQVNTTRLTDIEQHGSPIIQGIKVQLEVLTAGQVRIEKKLDDYISRKP